jgi:hypothetical protein
MKEIDERRIKPACEENDRHGSRALQQASICQKDDMLPSLNQIVSRLEQD